MIRVTVGNPLELKQPDGTVLNTHVRSIEMILGAAPERACMPLLLGEDLTKADLPAGSELWFEAHTNEMIQYHFPASTLSTLTSQLFTPDGSGHLRFGNSAVTFLPASIDNLTAGALEFKDELTTYLLTMTPANDRVTLSVGLLGLKHDPVVLPQIDASLHQAGITFTRDA
ncbi:hypothetical protein [uncultured Gimesia sp.]|uniref:hypothetical protein n=1 Tax=uncultured Gimesia sp. TaxID=1678688 RepID=UPI0030D6DE96|tara:strand:- start:31000 stop:31512 length:513 start_codon:yes stop_codon:yes gene_type:complete